MQKALSPLRVELPLRCSEWAEQHFYLSAESSADEGPFDPWPYQKGLLDVMGNDDVRVVTLFKCARIGYTKCLAALTGYLHEHKRRNCLIYQPTDQQAREFAKDTIDPMIRDVPVLEKLLKASGRNNKENTLGEKYFYGSVLHVRGGTSANNYRRLTKDCVMFDEVDGLPTDVEGEGDPYSLGDKRMRDSSFPKSIRGSTPTVEGESNIERSAQSADVHLRYYVPCPHCGLMQPLEWGGKEEPHGMKWTDNDPNTAHYVCRGCSGTWMYGELADLLDEGRWQDEGGHYIDGESDWRDSAGNLTPWPRHVAFYLWAAYSLRFPWPEIVYEFLSAKNDPVELKAFINTTLGECWKDTVEKVDPDPLLDRREDYVLPKEVAVLTIGADVQMDRVEYEVVGWGESEESWGIHYGIINGDPTKPEIWRTLEQQFKTLYKTEDGRQLRARIACVDSGYLSEQVYEFSRKAGAQFVIPTKGASTPGNPIHRMPRRPNDKRVYLTSVGTDNAKETVYRRLMLEEPGAGYCHFPLNDEYDEEYFRQLTGEEKRPRIYQGRKVMWFEQAYANVEALDCRVNALVAVRIAQERFGVALAPGTGPGAPPPQPKPQQPQQRRSGGMVFGRR